MTRVPDAQAGTPQRGGTATIGIVNEPPVLNSFLAIAGVQSLWLIDKAMFARWVDIAPGLQPVPELATTVPTLANGGVVVHGQRMTVSFAIRPDADWSDGVPITCDDMRFTWKTRVDTAYPIGARSGYVDISRVDCPTPKQVVITFDKPITTYLDEVLFQPPLPAHVLRGRDFATVWNQRIDVSSGPFVFDHWRHGVELRLKRNPFYFGRAADGTRLPYLDHLVFRFLDDDDTATIQLSTGELDVDNRILTAPPAERAQAVPTSVFQHAPATQIEQLGFQTARAPLNDVRVRQAVAYAIDREQLVHAAYGDGGQVLQSVVTPQQAGFYEPTYAKYHPDAAKVASLLGAAGYTRSGDGPWTKDGTPLTLSIASPDELAPKLTQLIQAQLAAMGIGSTISVQQQAVFFAQTQPSGKWDLAVWSINTFVDPGQNYYFDCAGYARGTSYWRWCDPDDMAAVRATVLEEPAAQRKVAIDTLQQRMADEVPLIPLFQRQDAVAFAPDLHGIRENSRGGLTWNVEQWWRTR